MATQKQIDANRRNAQKSTGPRTPEGKARSSRNALRHGLRAAQSVFPEEQHEFELLAAELRAELAPVGPRETLLVDRLAAAAWGRRRLWSADVTASRLSLATQAKFEPPMERAFYRSLRELQRLQSARNRTNEPNLPPSSPRSLTIQSGAGPPTQLEKLKLSGSGD